jgi:deazaflavin-dependent oxidoreductase (nitroreductase family)
MSTPKGTSGPRQSIGSRLRQWMSRMAANQVRRKGGRSMGMDVLILTTIGKKSGVERTTPVARFPSEDGGWLVVASAAGRPENPAWYHNIMANPGRVKVEVEGREVDVTAQELRGDERDAAWRQIVAAQPRFARYESAARVIPVIRLVPRDT